MRRFPGMIPAFFALLSGAFTSFSAHAATTMHTIHPGGFPDPMGPVAIETTHLYNIIFVIVAVMFVIVAGGMGYILWRYRRSNVGKPATFSHHTGAEILWTVIPGIICMFIAWESWIVMRSVRTMPEGGVNVEAVAYQFGWDFFYPDASENGVHVAAPEPTGPDPWLSQNGEERRVKELVVPVGVPVKVQVTAADVLHAFFQPKMGVKIDAIPGRINYTWFQADEPGKYLGQCAELCGASHSEMFFYVKAVPMDEYKQFLRDQRVAAGLTADPVSASTVSGTLVSGTAVTSATNVLVPVSSTEVSSSTK